ncbi:MAG: Holliday junction resolvase RuvX [Centipeda sp. (in: firmicutes)]|uniref:Holliday junction resolvase RuvX n=1 Tax=Selenomonas sp. oral taxon 920 TaxID=1884263 RepID=UPI000840F55C|nr:Holliday junction resolvase RuvX [Selenomonas sp. oral taxon 920]AOH48216.1 Holliday junction DNA helicase RuvA [Selenomonas sp. oral taxon 920]
MKRYLALDIGDATIGIAVSDLLGLTAQGVETIRRTELSADFDRLAQLVQEYEVQAFVAGLPKHMNGDEGARCAIVRAFMAEAAERFPAIEIHYWDERLSTVAAARALLEGDVSRKKRRKVIDKMAAVYILQGFLDRQQHLK